ncbi:MAG: hypothetical protein IH585_03890 [Anaerolineaceae bacterium]|nr:hypothetical protein [Anaerolineaceae bacterium]
MKLKKFGCFRFILFGFSTSFILCLILIVLVTWDNTHLPERSKTAERLAQQEKDLLIESLHLRQTIGNEVLPGWDQAEIPVILYNEAYAFLVDINSPPPDGWVTVCKREQLGAAWEIVPGDDFQGKPYYRQAISTGVTPQALMVKIGETYAATLTTHEYYQILMRELIRADLPGFLIPVLPYRIAIGLLIDSSDQYVTLILHEATHAYQGLTAPERLVAGEQANHDLEQVYPWENDSLREDWQAELDLLARALQAETDKETRQLTQEFLEVRQSRRVTAGLSADLIEFERHREWVEGIGRYAELSVYRLAQASSGYAPVEEILNDPRFHQYKKFDNRWKREVEQIKRMARDEDKSRFYYTTISQGEP